MKKTIELKGVDLQSLLGAGDAHLRLIESTFPGQIIVRGNDIHLDGVEKDINIVHDVIHEMMQTLNRKGSITKKDVRQLINISNVENGNIQEKTENVIHYGRNGAIQSRTVGQTEYIKNVRENDIVFSIGPAGTGKTYIAVAFAVAALESHQVDKIVLCRPAVEAGENLGFLPGDLQEKVDPYLTPLYDA
jgi:phosphate starvation-inducible PhoH-like protein